MKARANQGKPMTLGQGLALAVLVAMVIWIIKSLGPAIDRELGCDDAKIEAHRASLVSM